MLGIHVSFSTETLKINEQRAFSVLPFSFSLPGRKTFEGEQERGGRAGGGRAGTGGRRDARPAAAPWSPRRDPQTPPPRSARLPRPRAPSPAPPTPAAAAPENCCKKLLKRPRPAARGAFLGWGEERKVEKN